MKKGILFLVMLLLVSTVEAKVNNKPNSKVGYYGFSHSRPVTFVEKGVRFYIFLDGEMDFEILGQNSYYRESFSYYGNSYHKGKSRNRGRGKVNKTKRHGISNNFIHYDFYGRIKRIGNIRISYNFFDEIVQINRISISYRHHSVIRVGQLRIIEDRYGNLRYIGRVKPRHHHYHSGYYTNFYQDYFYDNYVYDWDDDFFEDGNFYNEYEQFEEDENFYYYRSKGKQTKRSRTGKKETKQKMIKRKKNKKSAIH